MTKQLLTRQHRLDRLRTEYESDPEFIHLHYGSKYVRGVGSLYPDVVFVSGTPTLEESRTGISLVGKERVVLTYALKLLDIPPNRVHVTQLLKYRPSNGREPRANEANLSLDYMWDELDILKPSLVVALGRTVSNVLFENERYGGMLGRLVNNEEDDHAFLVTHTLTNALMSPVVRHEQLNHLRLINTIIQ